MFNQIELVKAIAATGCYAPITHLHLMREHNRGWPTCKYLYMLPHICHCRQISLEQALEAHVERGSTKLVAKV